MKKMFVWLLLGAPLLSVAQDCNPFYNMKEGAALSYDYYDAKNKKTASSTTTVKNVKKTGAGIEAEMGIKWSDTKGKENLEGSMRVICKEDALYMDVSSLVSPQMMQSFGQMELSMNGDGLVIPNRLEVGQKLADSRNEFKVAMNGMNIMTMTMDITEHQVESREKITTPAGTFDCYKVSYVTSIKNMMVRNTSKSVHWYAKDVGVVQQESFDKKGNLESRMVLTALK